MEIAEFRKCDADTVFAIQQAAYSSLYEKYRDDINPYTESKETVLQKYIKPYTKGYLFYKDKVAVGVVRIGLSPDGKTGRVSALAVLPEYQNQRIAQEALLKIEQLHTDVEKWCLNTILQESGSCHLYEKLGYRRTGRTLTINDNMTLVSYEKP